MEQGIYINFGCLKYSSNFDVKIYLSCLKRCRYQELQSGFYVINLKFYKSEIKFA